MAYGDDRQQIASDAFPSSIDGNWANGEGDWNTCSWISSGLIRPGANDSDSALRRSAGTYDDDQYSTITCSNQDSSNGELVARVRCQSGTNESGYIGYNSPFVQYAIYENTSSFGFTQLAQTSTGHTTLTSGEELTIEAEGTTLRLGDDHTGSDTEHLTTTDNTITSGDPGLYIYGTVTTDAGLSAWAGGDIAPVFITDVDTDETWSDGDTGLVITGTGFVT